MYHYQGFGASPFDVMMRAIRTDLLAAPILDIGEWQAQQGTSPRSITAELQNVTVHYAAPRAVAELANQVIPHLPWAELHFQERVSGIPHNPPPSHTVWPFAIGNNKSHLKDEKFSHTYPERFWPNATWDLKEPAYGPSVMPGLRYQAGDLNDLVTMMQLRPSTRQAYLPVWFPEDLYAGRHGLRVPCTLGYHFMLRNDELTVTYFMRSCDFLRHFRDDVYLAVRLGQWVAERVAPSAAVNLVMHIASLHVFQADLKAMRAAAAHANAS